jgi:hypothetical protein
MRRLYSLTVPALITVVALDAIPTLPSVGPTLPMSGGLVAREDGTVFFADSHHRMVWRLDIDGRLSAELTAVEARGLELDAGGDVMVRGDGRSVVTRAPSGDLLVAHGSSLLRVSADGTTSLVAPGEPLLTPRPSLMRRLIGGAPGHLTGIAVDADGSIYVGNASRGVIVRIDPLGRARVVERCESGWAIAGLAVVQGTIFVLENGYGARVRRVGAAEGEGIASWVRPARSARASMSDPAGRTLL